MNPIVSAFAGIAAAAAATGIATAGQTPPQSYPFASGTLTITETEDFDKVLAFNGKELTRNYVVNYDRIVEVGGQQVALFDVGDGGNILGSGRPDFRSSGARRDG